MPEVSNDRRSLMSHQKIATNSEAGSIIDLRDRQFQKAAHSIPLSFDPDSNLTDDRRAKLPKLRWQITSTDAGTQTDVSEEQPDTEHSSIRTRFDLGSNVSDARDLRLEKVPLESTVSDEERQSDLTPLHPESALHPIV
jgi:hypothetical protein